MRTNGTKKQLASVAVLALVTLALVPAFAGSASAAPTPASTTVSGSASWAYGGEASLGNPGISIAGYSISWNATASIDVVYNATNTTANITELTGSRTVVVSISVTVTGPKGTASYGYKADENDLAYANITNAATVTAVPGGGSVPALGILNASLHANATIRAAVVVQTSNESFSSYYNVSGWGVAQIAFTPALGLVPLNLTKTTAWSANASAAGSAAWNVSWTVTKLASNATTLTSKGGFNGTWSKTTQVYLNGNVVNSTDRWNDHRDRTGIALNLSGPFDLHAGLFLIPRGFDLFGGAAHLTAASALGTSALQNEYVYLTSGPVSARSVSAASVGAGATTSAGVAFVENGGGPIAAATPAAYGTDGTIWAQPMSPQAAESQAACMEFGCAGSHSPFGGMLLPLGVAAVAALVAVALVIGTRSRKGGGKVADTPLAANPAPPTAPSGVPPSGGSGQPPR